MITNTQTEEPRLRWKRPLVARFWDYYAQHRPEDYFTRRHGDRIVALTASHIPAGGCVYDYGCGAGYLTEHLARRFRTRGVDFSPSNIEATRARLSGSANFEGAVLANEAQASGLVHDAAYLVETVEHLLDEDVDATLATVFTSLRPGGVVIVTTPNEENLAESDVFCPACSHTFHRWQHMRRFDANTLIMFMASAGFECMHTFATDFGQTNPLLLWLRRKFAQRPLPHLVYIGRRPVTG